MYVAKENKTRSHKKLATWIGTINMFRTQRFRQTFFFGQMLTVLQILLPTPLQQHIHRFFISYRIANTRAGRDYVERVMHQDYFTQFGIQQTSKTIYRIWEAQKGWYLTGPITTTNGTCHGRAHVTMTQHTPEGQCHDLAHPTLQLILNPLFLPMTLQLAQNIPSNNRLQGKTWGTFFTFSDSLQLQMCFIILSQGNSHISITHINSFEPWTKFEQSVPALAESNVQVYFCPFSKALHPLKYYVWCVSVGVTPHSSKLMPDVFYAAKSSSKSH